MNDVYKAIVAVTVTVVENGKMLLVKRQNTGFMDGYYATPGGHVDSAETIKAAAVRELKEETDLDVKEDDLQLFHVLQDENNAPKLYISFRFIAQKWSGKPKLSEPEKSSEVAFISIENPPSNLSPYVRRDLEVINQKGVAFTRAEKGEFYKEL